MKDGTPSFQVKGKQFVVEAEDGFFVDWERVSEEVGNDLVKKRKFLNFACWLYGDKYEDRKLVKVRYAPSIIARSESELFGISSPRFAFRAYLGEQGIATIRRRTKTLASLRASGLPREAVELLVEKAAAGNWLADCLLTAPERFANEHYQILSCGLNSDFGEDFPQESTPFVTHADVGGGLCAQAACFMALCLAPTTKKIYGIAEITRSALAKDDEKYFRISGLKSREITQFIDDPKRLGVGAQRQGAELRYTQEKLTPAVVARVARAIRTYIRNRVPVIQTASLARIRGVGQGVEKPIAKFGDKPVNYEDYSYIPLGFKPGRPKEDLTLTHSIVITGCSSNSFIFNDPASFPFIEAKDFDLVNAAPFSDPSKRSENRETYTINPEDYPDKALQALRKPPAQEKKTKPNEQSLPLRHLYECFSITPPGVKLPLLRDDFAAPEGLKNLRSPSGLFNRVDHFILNDSGYELSSDKDPCMEGEFHLVTWNPESKRHERFSENTFDFPHQAFLSLPVQNYLTKFPKHDFWLHHLPLKRENQTSPTIWLWGATDLRGNNPHHEQHSQHPYVPKGFTLQGNSWGAVPEENA